MLDGDGSLGSLGEKVMEADGIGVGIVVGLVLFCLLSIRS